MDNKHCGLCGNAFTEKEKVVKLPAISDVTHELYVYFDKTLHSKCFEKWSERNSAVEIIQKEKASFHQSSYYTKTFKKT